MADVVVGALEVGNVTPDEGVADDPADEAFEEAADAADVDDGVVDDEAETVAGDEPATTDTEEWAEAAEDVPAITAAVEDEAQAVADGPSSVASAAMADAWALASAELVSVLLPPLTEGSGPTVPSEENCVAMYVALSGIYVAFGLSYER